ncbi:hypothetical protein Nepgr_003670 [Nepenthes gracilis]|uniref:BHLH domain-containing protein n=1 Tax=Nepenthes gracilis TaxID=150966 RepID=A0AAD3XE97_NEPGR|nr:hypothetical protein Nepgr_003670 [Nepenthes gracilis]
MDMSDKDKLELDNKSEDCMNYHSSHLPSDWQYDSNNIANSSTRLIPNEHPMTVCRGGLSAPSCSSGSMANSFGPTVWQHSQPLGFNGIDVNNYASTSNPLGFSRGVPGSLRNVVEPGWEAASSVLKGGLFLPNVPGHSLSQFPADFSFIERAARFSSFSAGNFGDMLNYCGDHHSVRPHLRGGTVMQCPQEAFHGNVMKSVLDGQPQKDEITVAGMAMGATLLGGHGPTEWGPSKNEGSVERSQGVKMCGNESDEAEFSGGVGDQEEPSLMDTCREPSSAKGVCSKKRKKSGQGVESEQANGVQWPSDEAAKANSEIQHTGDQNPTSVANKTTGKPGNQSSKASDPPKEEYIHVRARRGQATNSHSLAERVRREKISERMKFLQDLVPGCSKVTGKAVMLDEIINYVQSLQRQVEFLSMKLAAVNPRLDFSIEELLAKDMFLARNGPSSTLGFSAHMPIAYPLLPPSQPPAIQPALPAIGISSDAMERNVTSHLTHLSSGYKEPTPQLPNVWEDELHNVVQMGFSASAPLSSQDINSGSLQSGHMKVEL